MACGGADSVREVKFESVYSTISWHVLDGPYLGVTIQSQCQIIFPWDQFSQIKHLGVPSKHFIVKVKIMNRALFSKTANSGLSWIF